MAKIYDVVATVGTYRKDGQEKRQYMNCGVILEGDNGKKYLKLSCLPFDQDGKPVTFMSLYEPGDGKRKQESTALPQSAPAERPDFDDKIPFIWAFLIPLGGLLAYASQTVLQV